MADFGLTVGDIAASTTASRELNGLRNDRLMTDRAIKTQQNKWEKALQGGLGNDIDSVLSGRVKVKLPVSARIKHWFNNLLNNISKIV